MSLLKERLGKIKPRYLKQFESLIKSYSQYGGGSEEEKFSKAKSFSNVYEMYIFAFFLGLRQEYFYTIDPDDVMKNFWEVENWKPHDVVEALIACSIGLSDFDMVSSELVEDEKVKEAVFSIQNTIEGYANGGLFIIKQEIEADEEMASDDLFFVKMLGNDVN